MELPPLSMVRTASLPSSLPAQAASATGSSRIAAHFAEIPKCNPLFKGQMPSGVLDLPQAKWNSHLADRRFGFIGRQFRPDTIGEAMARAGPDIRKAHGTGGDVDESHALPRIGFSRA